MKQQHFSETFIGIQSLNAVALKNAVLCADCDVVSDSPHDRCLVCGSRSLFNIAKLLGGNLPADRVRLTDKKINPIEIEKLVIPFPKVRQSDPMIVA